MHITITSSTRRNAPQADLIINCAHLPNPHQVPALRPRDGRNKMVKDWLMAQPEVPAFISQQTNRILTQQPTTITTTCNAGKHRSVMIAEALAQALEEHGHTTTVTHRELGKAKQPRRDGMGNRHQKQRARLNAQLKDGELCWWCGRPMHRTHDLHADHSRSRHYAGIDALADRLLHGACNEQRQKGDNDDRRPALNHPERFDMLPIRLKTGGFDVRYPGDTPTTRRRARTKPPVDSFTWG